LVPLFLESALTNIGVGLKLNSQEFWCCLPFEKEGVIFNSKEYVGHLPFGNIPFTRKN
jgi:hypothetical protein